jgi:two-component system, NarL family, sensor histidine kinase DesK
MSTWVLPASAEPWWSPRKARLVLAAVHVPFLLVSPLIAVTGFVGPRQSAALVVPLALAIAALQLRHSFAAARGAVPRYWPVTLGALALLVWVPLPWFKFDWTSMQWMFMASAAMLLRGRLRVVAIAAPAVGTALWAVFMTQLRFHEPHQDSIFWFLYWATSLLGGTVCIYGASQLVGAVDELFATRAELAHSTVGHERARLSRDLHDLLGQSLSAVSLKGDLALALLRSNAKEAAENEIRDLVDVARQAIRDMRHVVRGDRPVSLNAETKGAAVLLAAAGIDADIDVEPGNLSQPVDELLGWATREGVTNVLRHSEATCCAIRTSRHNGSVELKLVNDGATPSTRSGAGLSGLIERAAALSATVSADYIDGGRFRLLVHVPDGLR